MVPPAVGNRKCEGCPQQWILAVAPGKVVGKAMFQHLVKSWVKQCPSTWMWVDEGVGWMGEWLSKEIRDALAENVTSFLKGYFSSKVLVYVT